MDEVIVLDKTESSPVVQLIQRYQDEFAPIFRAVGKGLKGAAAAYGEKNNAAESVVGTMFEEASRWFEEMEPRLTGRELDELKAFVEEQQKKPVMKLAGALFNEFAKRRIR